MHFNVSRGVNRLISTVTSSAANTKNSTPSYPFSKTAITSPVPDVPITTKLQVGKGLMEHLRKTLPTPEKQAMIQKLFSRRSPHQLLPGSVVTVISEQAPTVFTGVLLAVRRRGQDTSFRVRNVIQRTGVEMQFFANSPGLKEIKLVRIPPHGRMRRAKLYYLRDAPDKMSVLAGGKK